MSTTELPVAFEESDYDGGSYKTFAVDGDLAMRIRYALDIDDDSAEVTVTEHLRRQDTESTDYLFSDLRVSCDGLVKDFRDPDSYGSGFNSNTLVRLTAWLDAEAPL